MPKPSYYMIVWREKGIRRKMVFQLRETAMILLDRLMINCKHYDAILKEVKQ